MKRIIFASALLLCALIICVCEFKAVKMTEEYKSILDKIYSLSEQGNYEKAFKLSTEINLNWQKTQKNLNKYLYHDYVDSISITLSSLPVYTKNQDRENIIATINDAKIKLASLKESELPYVYNIL